VFNLSRFKIYVNSGDEKMTVVIFESSEAWKVIGYLFSIIIFTLLTAFIIYKLIEYICRPEEIYCIPYKSYCYNIPRQGCNSGQCKTCKYKYYTKRPK